MHFWAQKRQKWVEIKETKTCAVIANISYTSTSNERNGWQPDKLHDIYFDWGLHIAFETLFSGQKQPKIVIFW